MLSDTGDNAGITVLGATNCPYDVDSAILRRLPRKYILFLLLFFSFFQPSFNLHIRTLLTSIIHLPLPLPFPFFVSLLYIGTFEIGLPNCWSRPQILELFLKKKQALTDGARKMIPKLTEVTEGYSGSDLKELWYVLKSIFGILYPFWVGICLDIFFFWMLSTWIFSFLSNGIC